MIYFSNSTSPSINFQKPSAEEIFKIILPAPEAYEEKHPLKNIRGNKIYMIRDCTIESVTCDNNGAYYKSNGNKRIFYVKTMTSNLTANVNVEVKAQDVFEIEKYYRWNKSIPNLKRTIYRIKNMLTMLCNPFLCIIYTLHGDSERTDNIEIPK